MVFIGASSGIGAATAILFSKLGASLVLSGRNEKAIDETIAQCDESARSRVRCVWRLIEFLSFKCLILDSQSCGWFDSW